MKNKYIILLLLFLSFIFSTISNCYSNFEKPEVPSIFSTKIVTGANNILDYIYNKKESYSDTTSYLSYINKVLSSLETLKVKYNSSDSRYILLNYLIEGTNNIKKSINNDDILSSTLSTINNSIVSNTTQSGITLIGTTTLCNKNLIVGNLNICDTGKKAIYDENSNSCPELFHVPNYREMKYIIDSGISLNDFIGSYYINNIYKDIIKVDGYLFNNNAFIYKNGSINHSTYMYGVSSTDKYDILCINNASNMPKNELTGGATWEGCKLDFSGLKGKYLSNRNYLFRNESIFLTSTGVKLDNGKFDYTLELSCIDSGLSKNEYIKNIYSCNYGYLQKDNDCVIDNTICNTENLGNTNPTNSKVCSRKDLGNESFVYSSTYRYPYNLITSESNIGYDETFTINIYKWFLESKNSVLSKYKTQYNNKVDINVTCETSEEKLSQYSYKLTYKCNVKGLFWQ